MTTNVTNDTRCQLAFQRMLVPIICSFACNDLVSMKWFKLSIGKLSHCFYMFLNTSYNAPPKTDRFGAQDSNQKTLCRHGQQLKKTTWSGVQGQGGS